MHQINKLFNQPSTACIMLIFFLSLCIHLINLDIKVQTKLICSAIYEILKLFSRFFMQRFSSVMQFFLIFFINKLLLTRDNLVEI